MLRPKTSPICIVQPISRCLSGSTRITRNMASVRGQEVSIDPRLSLLSLLLIRARERDQPLHS